MPRAPFPEVFQNMPGGIIQEYRPISMMREAAYGHTKFTICILPYMDGSHECITATIQGQHFFSTLLKLLVEYYPVT